MIPDVKVTIRNEGKKTTGCYRITLELEFDTSSNLSMQAAARKAVELIAPVLEDPEEQRQFFAKLDAEVDKAFRDMGQPPQVQ
ncbi:MAG TPA: hypothetical protein VN240_07035 [Propylenella sp.]|nr:hypothetical protein [Propylenella sp.]